ncbi:MAG: efflux transporter outer membrane subunit [Bacteroidia bacterium]|nr:efflux transporter outer membrane subunit [Bacteroidia bacterium]MDW8158423.1 efflux transporter outer membrane subunit [Bacteroidia bacterium]
MPSILKCSLLVVIFLVVFFTACRVPTANFQVRKQAIPKSYSSTTTDTVNIANWNWRAYFADTHLIALIDTALKNNQELNVFLQEIEISKNEVRARKGEYLPFVNIAASSSVEKPGRYTRFGALEEQLELKPGTHFPEPLADYFVGAVASWEIDIWKKLRNAKKSAYLRYLASKEGRNFLITRLIAEIAEAYYELMALDNLLQVIEKNIEIQSDALKVVKQQKEAAKLTQLAVNRFEAQLLSTQSLRLNIQQKIVETENRIHFLVGRFPQPIYRNSAKFLELQVDSSLGVGIPSQLLRNRPDIQRAELELAAAKLDMAVAKANFYPSLKITSEIGLRAFSPAYLFQPHSILYSWVGELMAPFINRNAIVATYRNATAKQTQALYKYEQTVLNAYLEVLNQLSKVRTYSQSFAIRKKQVDILSQSVNVASSLFNSARADYSEVLLTQREALEAKMEMIEAKNQLLSAKVSIYRALGGGWK